MCTADARSAPFRYVVRPAPSGRYTAVLRQRFDSPTQASQEREVVRGPVVGPDRVGAQSGATSMPWHATVASPHSEFGEGEGGQWCGGLRGGAARGTPPTQPLG